MSLKLSIRDSSIEDIFHDLANALKTSFTHENKELRIEVPKKVGKGHILGMQFSYGLGVLQFDCSFKQEVQIEHEMGIVHPLKLLFNKNASILHKFGKDGTFKEIRRLESAIVSSIPSQNHIFVFPGNKNICLYSLEINRKLFEEKIEDFLGHMDADLMEIFRDVNGTHQFYHKEYYSLDIAGFLEEFSECEFTDFMKNVYREGKVYEILSHQLQQYKDDHNGPKEQKIIRKATVEKIEEAVQIIQDEIDNHPTVISLAKRVGLNQNMLQKGFRRLYKLSVNEYVRSLRLERGKELLEDTELNIGEICDRIGINSRSYFSKLFKEKYGLAPKDYYQQYRARAASGQN